MSILTKPIRVRATEENGHYHLKVTGGGSNITPFYSDASAAEISNFLQEYRRQLYKARRSLGDANPECDISSASRFFRDVHNLARTLFFMICRQRAPELSALFQQRRALDAATGANTAPLIVEVEHPEAVFLPLEIFPLADTHAQNPATTLQGLLAQARCFVGMSAIIRRVRWTGEEDGTNPEIDQNRELRGEPLPIKVFYDASLEGARREAAFFLRRPKEFFLEGPWPPDLKQGERVRELVRTVSRWFSRRPTSREDEQTVAARLVAQHMRDPALGFNAQPRNLVDQIQHFCCHCDPSTAHQGSYCLRVRGKSGNALRLETTQIQAELFSLLNVPLNFSLPLVFLNACGTGAADSKDFDNLPRVFTATGSRAVVCTQTRIPDGFAASLSEAFYSELVAPYSKMTVGEALHRAKWRMLTLAHNPLGLLYTLHGDPDLRVSSSV